MSAPGPGTQKLPLRCTDGAAIEAQTFNNYPWEDASILDDDDIYRLTCHLASWTREWLAAVSLHAAAPYAPPAAEVSAWFDAGTVPHPAIGTPLFTWIAPGFPRVTTAKLGIAADAIKVAKRTREKGVAAWIDSGWPQYRVRNASNPLEPATVSNAAFEPWPDTPARKFFRKIQLTYRDLLPDCARTVKAVLDVLANDAPEAGMLHRRHQLYKAAANSFTAVYVTQTDPAMPAGTRTVGYEDEIWFVVLVDATPFVVWVVTKDTCSSAAVPAYSF
jgi:hypothetical protein